MARGLGLPLRGNSDRALELDDNYVPAHQWFALYLAAQGRTDDALKQMQFAQKIDPCRRRCMRDLAIFTISRVITTGGATGAHGIATQSKLDGAHAVLGWSYTEQKRFPGRHQPN